MHCWFILCLTIVISTVSSFTIAPSLLSAIIIPNTTSRRRRTLQQRHIDLQNKLLHDRDQGHNIRLTTTCRTTKYTTQLQAAMPNNVALRATAAASTTVTATIGLLCIVAAVTWTTAYSRGRRHGRSELAHDDDAPSTNNKEESVSKPEHDKKKDEQNNNNLQSNNNMSSLTISPIGQVSSIYRLCVGTPRQGMLAKHSRGIITFDETQISIDSILELENYSHVYVVFIFHLNSNMKMKNNRNEEEEGDTKKKKNGSNNMFDGNNMFNIKEANSSSYSSSSNNNNKRQFKGKISPPSLGGKKVGVFSTRTPHRPNNIGFSLCKLDKVIVHNNNKKKKGKKKKSGGSIGGNGKGKNTFSLLLSGLDLVDGTPIL